MAKAPVAGRVKTRLCPPCTPAEAAAIAEAALADTLEAVRGCGAARHLLALDGAVGPWLPDGFHTFPQRGGDLGQRLAAAWRVADGPGVQIGMDTPQVGPDDLDRALSELHRPGIDAVLGPAADGGWWLIGMRRPQPGVFDGIPWSCATTGVAQLHRLHELGLRVSLLETRRDVDTIDDALAVAEEAPHLRMAATLQRITAHAAA